MKKLNNAIQDINKEGRARMLKAFDIVNGHFKKLFQTKILVQMCEFTERCKITLSVNSQKYGCDFV